MSLGNAERHDRGAPTACLRRGIPEIDHERCARQDPAHHLSLNSDSLSVDDADPTHAAAVRFVDVVFNHRADLTARNRVEVQHVLELDDDDVRERILEARIRRRIGLISLINPRGAGHPERARYRLEEPVPRHGWILWPRLDSSNRESAYAHSLRDMKIG